MAAIQGGSVHRGPVSNPHLGTTTHASAHAGNGAGDVEDCNWYGWLMRQLQSRWSDAQVRVELRNMPDPVRARETVWLPFMVNQLGCGENSIIVGHSSGAAAGMRLAESRKVLGLVLVGAYASDLGDANEAASGYFSR